MAEWFKDWFSSSEYLELYRHRDDTDARELCELISGSVPLKPGMKLLDVACGSGRHASFFARKGCSVFAFDLSRQMLSLGRTKAAGLNLPISFFCCDVRHFALRASSFDIATNLFTSFGYFEKDEDNFAIFCSINNALFDGGYFVFDYLNAGFLRKNLRHETIDKYDGKTIIQRRTLENNRVVKSIKIKDNFGEKTFRESVRLYDSTSLVRKLTECGFTVRNIYGDYFQTEFSEEHSQRLVIIAQKS